MTKNNFKTILLSVMITSALISSIVILQNADAEKQTEISESMLRQQLWSTVESSNENKTEAEPVPEPYIEDPYANSDLSNFKEIDENEMKMYEEMILADPVLKSLLGEEYKYSSTVYRMDPVRIYFEINYDTMDNHWLNIAFEHDQIIRYEKYEKPEPWGYINGVVDKHYDGTSTIDGVAHNFAAPTSFSSTQPDWNALLVNGLKKGSDIENDDLCDSWSSPDSHWAQGGIDFSSSGMRLAYTDTVFNCVPQFMTGLTVNVNDDITARVYIDDTVTDKWVVEINNLNDGLPSFKHERIVSSSTELEKDTVYTSVWWENNFTPSQGWDTDFGSDPVSDWASYKSTSDGLWYLWTSEVDDTSHCKPTPNPTGLTSGAFDTGNRDVTWDVSEIDDKCGRGWY